VAADLFPQRVTFAGRQFHNQTGLGRNSSSRPELNLISEKVRELRILNFRVELDAYKSAMRSAAQREFLKEYRRIEEQDKRIDQLTPQLKEQAALIQKVNNKVELSRPAPQSVANNRSRGGSPEPPGRLRSIAPTCGMADLG
jgi:hypothetical protein